MGPFFPKYRVLLLSLCLLHTSAVAQEQPAGLAWYLAPGISYIAADDARLADDNLGGYIGLGYPLSTRWAIELIGHGDTLKRSDASGHFQQRGISLDTHYRFGTNHLFSPYVVAGLGAMQTKYAGASSTHATAQAGLGVWARLTDEGYAFRSDIRVRLDRDDASLATQDSFSDLIFTMGINIPFGRHKLPELATVDAAPPPPPPDSDNDGVIDTRDQCPGTPLGIVVDEVGCELDGHSDGVVDRLDQCPGTPTGFKVDEHGCEPDSDGDSVVDRLDRCPDTPPGTQVDNSGCPLKQVTVLEGVTFAFNSSTLNDDAKTALGETIAILRRYPALHIKIAGHTDNEGGEEYNQVLSLLRAEAVMQYLIFKGISKHRLSARGYGNTRPVADNDSEEGRRRNRRVELHMVED